MCYICQEHKISEGHETKWCPKNFCKQCGQKGHTKIGCMSGMEDLPFSKKILDKIVSFLNIKDLDKFSKVSKKVFEICAEMSKIQRILTLKKCPKWAKIKMSANFHREQEYHDGHGEHDDGHAVNDYRDDHADNYDHDVHGDHDDIVGHDRAVL